MGIDKIKKGITQAHKKAFKITAEVDDLKWIVFSDHHRGSRDGADDFAPCEENYLKALDYYLKRDYTLMLLGDVEEFWENPLDRVMRTYNNVLDAEKVFYDRNKFIRIWGNHDDNWRFVDVVNRLLGNRFNPLKVYEAVELNVLKEGQPEGKILFVHGHQGTLMSSKLAGLSKFFVRFGWRPIQRIFKIPLSTPARDKGLRGDVNRAMHQWAKERDKQLIVCGHTHQYIFGSNKLPNEPGKPCYFNTGCCSYGNGNISGMEISNEKIRLVEWTPDDTEPYYIAREELSSVFERCT